MVVWFRKWRRLLVSKFVHPYMVCGSRSSARVQRFCHFFVDFLGRYGRWSTIRFSAAVQIQKSEPSSLAYLDRYLLFCYWALDKPFWLFPFHHNIRRSSLQPRSRRRLCRVKSRRNLCATSQWNKTARFVEPDRPKRLCNRDIPPEVPSGDAIEDASND